jgi:hypothetical protein
LIELDLIDIPTTTIARRAFGIVDRIGIPTTIIACRAYGIIMSDLNYFQTVSPTGNIMN